MERIDLAFFQRSKTIIDLAMMSIICTNLKGNEPDLDNERRDKIGRRKKINAHCVNESSEYKNTKIDTSTR